MNSKAAGGAAMLRYVKGYIFEGHTFVVNKSDIHNAKDEQFAEGTALMPDGWISVNDRLPRDNERVFVYRDNMDELSISVVYGWSVINKARERGITHWMPLPEPPKGDDED